MKSTQSSAKGSGSAAETNDRFTAEEREAMKERAKELKTARRSPRGAKADAEGEVLAKIAEMPEADRVLAERVHDIVRTSAPNLTPRLWYGMPAYAKNGKVLCFFQSAQKFKSRYATLGFSDQAALDDGSMWPTAYALAELSAAEEERISALVRQAAG
ncbi:iron chaperone [Streptomyces sp. HK10]|uniref:iron chaperone n=1 Tax=Streptomyces sp. HK10 TaxID=3373255 RepID=UPI0037489359